MRDEGGKRRGPTGDDRVDAREEGLVVEDVLGLEKLLGVEVATAAEAEDDIGARILATTGGLELGGEGPQPGEEEEEVGEQDHQEEEPLPGFMELVYGRVRRERERCLQSLVRSKEGAVEEREERKKKPA